MNVETAYRWLRNALASARWVFGPLALLFLVIAALGSRGVIENVVRHAYWPALVLAAILWAALHLLSPVFTWVVLRGFGTSVSYADTLVIHVNRLPARYLPGGIWHTVSRVADLRSKEVSRTQLAVMVALENALPVSVALILGGVFLLVAGHEWPYGALCIAAGIAILAFLPMLFRHRAVADCRIAAGPYCLAIGITIVFWLGAGTAFARYWLAFPAQGASGLASIYAAYFLGWASGFVAVFAPQGLGVFESVAGVLLRGALPFAGTAMLVAGFRAVILAADVIAYAVFSVIRLATRRTRIDTISDGRL